MINDYDKEVNWGREFGEKIADKFNLMQIEIEDKYYAKDFSDFVKGTARMSKSTLHQKTSLPSLTYYVSKSHGKIF
jgi:hypothetical protein